MKWIFNICNLKSFKIKMINNLYNIKTILIPLLKN